MQVKKYPTVIGYSALIFWALAAPFTVKIRAIPVFETLTVVFTVSFFVSIIRLTYSGRWAELKQPWFLWCIGFLGIYGNDLLYIAAFKHAPPAQADLINYLWPVIVILFTGLLPDEKLSFKHILAAAFGFTGVYVLINQNGEGLDSQYLFGYILAFLDAVVWSVYTLVARRFGKSPVEMIGMYCGAGAICSFFIHFYFEPFYTPQLNQWIILFCMGLTTQCLAYFFWDFGIKRGDFKLLSILSYGNPILSIAFLILFGMAKPSFELFLACILVSFGGLIGVIRWQKIYSYLTTLLPVEIASGNDSQ